MDFWLGLHQPNWLEQVDVPTMVSYQRLRTRKKLPRARSPWVLDSGGFSELSLHGKYRTSPTRYVEHVRRYVDEVGNLKWVAIQDWMCEDAVIDRTGLSVVEHQWRTVVSYLVLMERAPEIAWLPVLQGQVFDDYQAHVDMYTRAGVDLRQMPLVGVGTVCRRQHTQVAVRLMRNLAGLGLRLHGFGLKVTALTRVRDVLASADSMAWSFDGRMPDGGRCQQARDHRQCANCLDYALRWRGQLMDKLSQVHLLEAA